MFNISDNKGFHLTFANGYTVSVQWGAANYGGNYDLRREERGPNGEVPQSPTAEVGVWDQFGWHALAPGDVAGYQTPAEVLAILVAVAALPERTEALAKPDPA